MVLKFLTKCCVLILVLLQFLESIHGTFQIHIWRPEYLYDCSHWNPSNLQNLWLFWWQPLYESKYRCWVAEFPILLRTRKPKKNMESSTKKLKWLRASRALSKILLVGIIFLLISWIVINWESAVLWTCVLGKDKVFHGGSVPDLFDLAVFGTCRVCTSLIVQNHFTQRFFSQAVEHTQTWFGCQVQTCKIAPHACDIFSGICSFLGKTPRFLVGLGEWWSRCKSCIKRKSLCHQAKYVLCNLADTACRAARMVFVIGA